MSVKIFHECFNDRAFLLGLGVPAERLKRAHRFGKGNVCNALEKNRDCMGLVDEDPQAAQPGYINRLSPLTTANLQNVRIFSDNGRNNVVIVVSPDIERYIMRVAKIVKVDMTQYDVPNDLKKLHDLGKDDRGMEKIRGLISRLAELSRELQALRSYLRL